MNFVGSHRGVGQDFILSSALQSHIGYHSNLTESGGTLQKIGICESQVFHVHRTDPTEYLMLGKFNI